MIALALSSLFSGSTDFQEPYAVVILLEKDLVVIDLAQIGYANQPHPVHLLHCPSLQSQTAPHLSSYPLVVCRVQVPHL